jgi:uncharacterized MAPEG superfamily protein
MSIFNVNCRNYSIYTIPAAWLLAQSVSPRLRLKSLGLGHNECPREDLAKASSTLPAAEAAKLKRREAAHLNGFENFPLFAAAIIVGNEAGLPARTLNFLGVGYLITRGVYNWLYTTVSKEKTSHLRYEKLGARG